MSLIYSAEKVIKSMEWKAFFTLNPGAKSSGKKTYGFKSTKTPPQLEEMKTFKEEVFKLVKNVQFKEKKMSF